MLVMGRADVHRAAKAQVNVQLRTYQPFTPVTVYYWCYGVKTYRQGAY